MPPKPPTIDLFQMIIDDFREMRTELKDIAVTQGKILSRLEEGEKRMDRIEKKLDDAASNMGGVETRLDTHSREIKAVTINSSAAHNAIRAHAENEEDIRIIPASTATPPAAPAAPRMNPITLAIVGALAGAILTAVVPRAISFAAEVLLTPPAVINRPAPAPQPIKP